MVDPEERPARLRSRRMQDLLRLQRRDGTRDERPEYAVALDWDDHPEGIRPAQAEADLVLLDVMFCQATGLEVAPERALSHALWVSKAVILGWQVDPYLDRRVCFGLTAIVSDGMLRMLVHFGEEAHGLKVIEPEHLPE